MKILIVQTSFIGDSILSTPVIRELKNIYPNANLSILTTPVSSGLFFSDPLIDEIMVFDKRGKEKGLPGVLRTAQKLKSKKFDRVYSLHRSYRTSLLLFFAKIPIRIGFSDAEIRFLYTHTLPRDMGNHAVISNLSILFSHGTQERFDTSLRLCPPPKNKLKPDTLGRMADLSDHYAVLSPGSAWKTKQWHAQGFIEVGRHLKAKGLDVVLMGGPDDVPVCRQIGEALDVLDLSGQIPLSDTIYLVDNSRLLICNDSMALHMGSALKTPTVVIFCATSPSFGFGPWQNKKAIIVEEEALECKPCRRHGGMSCPTSTQSCMTMSSQKVIYACDKLLVLG